MKFGTKSDQKMTNWDDFSKDGLRLERIIKILFRHLKKAKSDEKIVRPSNSITFITAKKMEVAKLRHNIEEILEHIREQQKHREQIQKSFR